MSRRETRRANIGVGLQVIVARIRFLGLALPIPILLPFPLLSSECTWDKLKSAGSTRKSSAIRRNWTQYARCVSYFGWGGGRRCIKACCKNSRERGTFCIVAILVVAVA